MGVRADEPRDAGADHGVVRFDFNVHAREQVVGDFAAVAVGAFGDEGVRAGAAVDEIDQRDGGLAAGDDEGVAGGFYFRAAGGGLWRGLGGGEAGGLWGARRPALGWFGGGAGN